MQSKLTMINNYHMLFDRYGQLVTLTVRYCQPKCVCNETKDNTKNTTTTTTIKKFIYWL